MQLIRKDITKAPDDPGFTRVIVEIALDGAPDRLRYWFHIPSSYERYLSRTGNPWLVLMLPIASRFGEPIRIAEPVDQLLVDNLRGLQRLWRSWYPELHPVEIEASEVYDASPAARAAGGVRKTSALFMSGGIDSLFTLLRHSDRVAGDGTSTVEDLISIGGFNTSIADRDDIRRSLQPIADRFGKTLVPVSTNLRYSDNRVATPYSEAARMDNLAHGCALAVFGHLLEGRYNEILIAATRRHGHLRPWGSHPLSDPLLSSRGLRVVHDGACFSRIERVATVARHDAALEVVHVCWRERRKGNCSRCKKCLGTMAILDMLGFAPHARTFDWSTYNMRRLSGIDIGASIPAFQEIVDEARRRGREDIADAISRNLARSRRTSINRVLVSDRLSRRWRQAVRRVHSILRRMVP
jgi:hypothetical protein